MHDEGSAILEGIEQTVNERVAVVNAIAPRAYDGEKWKSRGILCEGGLNILDFNATLARKKLLETT